METAESHIDKAELELNRARAQEQRDERWAERGERLKRFVRGEALEAVWAQDLLPLIESLYGRYLRAMVGGKAEAVWALRALEDLVESIAGSVQLGEGAIRRIAERRFGKAGIGEHPEVAS